MGSNVRRFSLTVLFSAAITSWANAQGSCDAQMGQLSNDCDGSQLVSSRCDGCDAYGGRCGACQSHSLLSSPTLTGDWLGLRSRLQESGVTFAGRSTHFAFGVSGGIDSPLAAALLPLEQGDAFEYTGRGEYDLLFDLEKFGGLPYGRLLVRAEHWYGEWGNVSLNTGAFAPAVFPAAIPPVPDDQGVPYITNFLLTQPLSENFAVFAGKKDVLGAADQAIFAGGDGTTQFVNQAFIANPAFLLALPYTSFTMGVASPQSWGMLSGFIYDPKDRTKDFFKLDDLFADGIIVGAEIKLNTNFFELPGEQHIGGVWKNVDLPDLQFRVNPPGDYPYDPAPGLATRSDSYTIYYGFDQYFKTFDGERPGDLPQKDPKGWGLFGRASISDGNPTPLRYFLSLGIGGNSPVGDQNDNWGLGWYFVGASDEFGLIPRTLLDPQDGTGVEGFYNFQILPWLNMTPDVQYIRPGNRAISNDAFVYGVRVNMTL